MKIAEIIVIKTVGELVLVIMCEGHAKVIDVSSFSSILNEQRIRSAILSEGIHCPDRCEQ